MEKFRYNCTYLSGGGNEYDDGIWTIHTTPKRIVVEKIEDNGVGIYANHRVGQKIRIGNGTGNPISYADDNELVVYFNKAGTPYIFTKI